MASAKIMVVEDEFIVARDLGSLLTGLGYQVSSLRSTGEDAVKAAQEERPDLILMDIVLAGEMDGVQAALAIKDSLGIPVVFLTAYADKQTIQRAKLSEPLAYVLKPFQRRELEAAIELALYKAGLDAKLKESEERYRTLVENTHEGVVVLQEGASRFYNQRMLVLSGRTAEEFKSTPLLDMVHPDDRAAVDLVLRLWLEAAGTELPDPFRFLAPEGRESWVELSLGRINWEGGPALLLFFHDITERKRLETRIQKSQKLQSLGLVAGGVAHVYNNILAGIMGGCELALDDADTSPAVRTELERIRGLSERAAELTKRMLEYAGKAWTTTREIDVNQLLREIRTVAKAPLPPGARLVLDLGHPLPSVMGDPLQLQQMVLALVGNAAEALSANGAGVVAVRTKAMHCDREFLQASYLYEDQEPGDFVMLEVADNGAGIPAGDRDRLFDPFFTTKFVGRGLGLAAVMGIVRSMKGAILVESEDGHGSSFRLYFPAARGEQKSL